MYDIVLGECRKSSVWQCVDGEDDVAVAGSASDPLQSSSDSNACHRTQSRLVALDVTIDIHMRNYQCLEASFVMGASFSFQVA